MNDYIQLQRYVASVARWWWIIILATVVGAALGFGVSSGQPKVYTAYTTLLVGGSIDSSNVETKDLQVGQQLALTYANLARREPVLQGTVEKLSLHSTWRELLTRVQVRQVKDTQLFEIRVDASSPEEAQRTADEIARQLILLSPTGDQQNLETFFVRQQLESLQAKIEAGQARVEELKMAQAKLLSATPLPADQLTAAQVQEIQNEINVLNRLIVDWQANYAQLVSLPSQTTDPFVREQLENLRTEIETGQARVRELNLAIADLLLHAPIPPAMPTALPAEQAQEIQREINALEGLMAGWQDNYTRLLEFTGGIKKSSNYLTVIEPAQVDPAATRPWIFLDTLLAGLVGLTLALGLVGVLGQARLSNSFKSTVDLTWSQIQRVVKVKR